ncbi:DUF4355 domain-containing protein [Radiobacillus sp. PE A8.2]|uniref:DUF4355 domain-containing protein n=1 Tax=Radiobacillus sp. PE A8.2 TaxID=3380349 RepID=UPI00388D0DCB
MDLEQIKQFLEDNKDQEDVKAYIEGLSQVTPDGVEAFLETDEGKKLLQPKLDNNFTKGLETWKKNNLKKIVDEEVKKSNPKETPEQKRIRELEDQFTSMEKEKTRESLKNKALTTLNEKKLPSNLIDYLIGEDEESTLSNLGKFEEVFTTQLQSAVDERLKADGTDLKDNKKPTAFTKEQIDSMSTKEINDNWESIKDQL